MDCNDSRNRLHAYLDQELDAPSALAIDEHVASCPACKALFTEQAALQAGVRRHAAYHGAPARLADRIRASIDATAVRTPRRWFQLGAAVAATALVSWLAAVQYSSPSTPPESSSPRMCGCCSRAAIAISRKNRSVPSVLASSGRSTFTATRRA